MEFSARKYISLVYTLILVFETRSEFLLCKTPYGAIGKCKPVSVCESMHQLASKSYLTQKEINFLKRSKCGEVNNNPLICCPKQNPVHPASKPTAKPLKPSFGNYVPPEETCKTPIGETGHCEIIYNCPVLFNILSKNEFSEKDQIFLIKSKCGKAHSEKFCCPKQSVTGQNLLKLPSTTIAQEPKTCQTPTGKLGDCKPIRDCPSLFGMLSKPEFTVMDRIYLIQSKCGKNESVCCPKEFPAPSAPSKPLVRTLVFPDSQCQTKKGISGICKFRKDCSFTNIPFGYDSGENEDCGSVNGEWQVCCPVKNVANDLRFPLEVTATTNVPIVQLPPIKLIFSESFCKTPLQENGTCVSIMECDPLLRLVTKPSRAPMETMYLEKSICGKSGERKVCCPTSVAVRNTTTRPTTTTQITRPHSAITSAESVEKWTNDPQCGRVSLEEKIFGGRSTRIDEYPWTVRLIYISANNDIDYLCGGSLINKDFVITAAHCVHDSNLELKWFLKGVRLGEWNTSTEVDCDSDGKDCAPPHKDIGYLEYTIHPQYKPNNYDNDIALLRLENTVSFTDFIQPICLPSKNRQAGSYDNEIVEVAGWGATETSAHSDVKLKATLRVLNATVCEYKIRGSENKICAQGEKGSDTCNGDSGGPLMHQNTQNNRIYLIGVVSFGAGTQCGAANTTGVYTRVAAYMDWIVESVMNSV